MAKIQPKKILSKITFENILILYIVLQPIIDIITSLCVRNINENLTLGIFVRTIFMIFIAIYTLIKTDKKNRWKILIYYSLIAIYCIAFIVNSYSKYGLSLIFTQIKGLVKTFYFPILLASLLVLFKENKYSSKHKYLNISLAIYVLTILICKIFSIGYPTYPLKDNVGTIGLFYAGNETSAIIALLSPICFATFVSKKFNIFNAILCAITVFAMLEVGTKVACVSTIALLALAIIISLIKLIRKEQSGFYKQFITLLLIVLLTFLFIGNTNGGKNLKINPIVFKEKIKTESTQDSKKEESTKKKPSTSKPKTTTLLSGRNNFFKNTLKIYNTSPVLDKSLGIGYISPKKDVLQENKLVEIDYFDIFFCHGIIGTVIYVIPLVILIFVCLKRFFVKFLINIRNYTLIFMIYSILLGFGIALTAGHVFTAPAVSMFLILSILELYAILNHEKDLKNE